MTLRCDLTWRLDSRGWTETYYLDPPSEPLLDTMDRLVTERMKISTVPAMLRKGRIVNLAAPKFPAKKVYNLTHNWKLFYGFPGITSPIVPADIAEHSIGIGFRADPGSHRVLWISGIPVQEKIVSLKGQRQILDPNYKKELDTFRNALVSDNLNLQLRVMPQDAIDNAKKVASVGVAADGRYLITTVEAHGLEGGKQVRILGSRGNNLTRARGLRKIVGVPSATSFVIDRGPLPEEGQILYTGGAVAAAVGFTYAKAEYYDLDQGQYTKKLTFGLVKETFKWGYLVASKLRGSGHPPRRGRRTSRK